MPVVCSFGYENKDIFRKLRKAYGKGCASHVSVGKWAKAFRDGRPELSERLKIFLGQRHVIHSEIAKKSIPYLLLPNSLSILCKPLVMSQLLAITLAGNS
jgi:hypothetical protein